MRLVVGILVLSCLLTVQAGKILVHPTQEGHAPLPIVDAKSTKFHVSTGDAVDLEEDGIPEQTITEEHKSIPSTAVQTENKSDVTSAVRELPEQTVSNSKGDQQLLQLDENNDNNDEEADEPKHLEEEGGSDQAPTLDSDLVNPLTRNSRPKVVDVVDSRVMDQTRADPDVEAQAEITAGNHKFEIAPKHARNFLDAARVQIGTSLLGHSVNKPGEVAKYRIRFQQQFRTRPVILVTTVPEGAENVNSVGPHPDVFVASVSDIGLDYFVVNIVRVDSVPHNGWGQELFLDWIAMEYDSSYPELTQSTGDAQVARNLEGEQVFSSRAEQVLL